MLNKKYKRLLVQQLKPVITFSSLKLQVTNILYLKEIIAVVFKKFQCHAPHFKECSRASSDWIYCLFISFFFLKKLTFFLKTLLIITYSEKYRF